MVKSHKKKTLRWMKEREQPITKKLLIIREFKYDPTALESLLNKMFKGTEQKVYENTYSNVGSFWDIFSTVGTQTLSQIVFPNGLPEYDLKRLMVEIQRVLIPDSHVSVFTTIPSPEALAEFKKAKYVLKYHTNMEPMAEPYIPITFEDSHFT